VTSTRHTQVGRHAAAGHGVSRFIGVVLAFACTVMGWRGLPAQSSQAIVDSAAQARLAFRAAAKAATLDETISLLLRASRAWPTQPAYWTATARMAARATDTAALREAVVALADMHAGASLLVDTTVQRVARASSLRRDMDRLARATATQTSGRVVATLRDSSVFAEGIDADPRTKAMYVASVRHRTIYEISADRRVRDLQLSPAAGIGAMLGVRVSPDGQSLYATTAGLPMMRGYTAADSSLAAIVQIRRADGAVVARWDIPVDGARHLLGDLTIANDGTVFASDSYAPVIWRLRVGATVPESIRHTLFRSLQGLALVPGGAQLIVADYSHGLLRVELSTGAVARIGDLAGATSLGIDGIVWHHDGVIAVQNGIEPARVAKFVFDETQTRIVRVDELDRQPLLADEPTIGTLWRGGFVYVANSQWEKYDDARRRPGTTLRPTLIMCIPLLPIPANTSRRNQDSEAAARKGIRSTTSAPPSVRGCRVSDAAPP
jgi:DNA-binding beta-propeller fold protein YncE